MAPVEGGMHDCPYDTCGHRYGHPAGVLVHLSAEHGHRIF